MAVDLTGLPGQVVTALAVAIPVSLFTSWITVRLALRRFRSERLWEKKQESYGRILEALERLHSYFTWVQESIESPLEHLPSKADAMHERYNAGRTEIAKFALIGDAFVSDRAIAPLRALIRDLERTRDQSPIDNAISKGNAVGFALQEVQDEARRDLRRL